MKSTTVKFNIFSFLTLTAALILAYLGFIPKDSPGYVVAVIVVSLVSQAITFFSPSGEFVGHGQDWSVGKWVTRIGAAVTATLLAVNGYGIGAAVTAAVMPLIEIVIRVYGSATETQKSTAKTR